MGNQQVTNRPVAYDPHDDSFCAKNLREMEWVEYQRDAEVHELADQIKEIVDRMMIAKVTYERLQELEFMMGINAETPAVLFQYSDGHWAAMAIAMLTGSRFKKYDLEQVVRFEKSPYTSTPMYYNNIEYVQEGRWEVARRRSEIKVIGTTRYGKNYKTDGIVTGRIEERNETGQGSLFDVH